jgi:hypothetical protein
VSILGDIGNPRSLDAAVRRRLASSLAYIFGKVEGRLEMKKDRCEAALEHIRTHRQDPGVFSRYYDLIFAIKANQLEVASTLIAELLERAAKPVSFAITAYTRENLGSDYERFPRLVFAEFSQANPMKAPSEEAAAAAFEVLREAMDVISRVDPTIYGEIDGLLVRIYLAASSNEPEAKRFGGVTSFLVWGGSFMNVDAYKTRWDAVQYLVHEITHGLLFGLSADQPLVLNPPAESYKSPLRADPRPMDGLFHATVVCARLAAFNQAWLESGLMQAGDRAKAEPLIKDSKQKFEDGLATVNEFGKLSDQARHLIDRSCSGLAALA